MTPFPHPPESARRRSSSIPPHTQRPAGPARTTSARIAALGPAPSLAEVDHFWRQVCREGTPLIEESDSGNPGECIFTFVHRGPARQVALMTNKLLDHDLDQIRFERVGDSDLWWLSLRLGSGWRGSYSLAIDDGSRPVLPEPMLAELEARRERSLMATPTDQHPGIHAWYELQRLSRPDPLARGDGPDGSGGSDLAGGTGQVRGPGGTGSVAAGPDAPAPVTLTRPVVPGRLIPVPAAGPVQRPLWWYLPAGEPAREWTVLVLCDGDRWVADGTATLDRWAAAGLLTDTAVLLVGHGSTPQRVADLTCNPEFIVEVTELLAGGAELLGAPATDRAEHTTIAGQSLGGLTALYAQCVAPQRFGTSLCQSGSFWWPNADQPGEVAEWLTAAIEGSDIRLSRVHLEVGRHEWVLLEPTRRLREVLGSHTRSLTYQEFDGGHDTACWQVQLPHLLADRTAPN